MKRSFLKRTMALAVAVAMTVTSLPTNVAFAEEVQAEVLDEIVDEGSDQVAPEETPTTEAVEGTTEAAGTEEAGLDPVIEIESVEELSAEETTQLYAATAPIQVTNVHFDTENTDTLCWNGDPAAAYYEVAVTVNGVEYTATTNYLSLYMSKYYFKDAGYNNPQFASGSTYMVKVRSVNTYETVQYGAWSAEVAYVVPAVTAPVQVTDVAVVNDYITFSDSNHDERANYYELEVKDSAGRAYYSGYNSEGPDYSGINQDDNLPSRGRFLCTYAADASGVMQPVTDEKGDYVHAFQPGQTYTIRVRGVNEDTVNNKTVRYEGAWSEAVSYAPVEKAVPGKIGGLEYKDETLSWNQVDNVGYYEIEIKDAAGNEFAGTPEKVNGSWTTNYCKADYYEDSISVAEKNNLKVYKISGDSYETLKDAAGNDVTAFTRGQTYTVRVRGYNYSGIKAQYGEWSDACTFTFAEKTVTAPAKVSALNLQGTTLSWKADESSTDYTTTYEIQVVGEDGTQYGTSASVQDAALVYSNYNNYYNTVAYISNLKNALRTYAIVNDSAQAVVHPETGAVVTAFEGGKTYMISVRAIRRYSDGTVKEGEWSNQVSYNDETPAMIGVNTKPATVTGVNVLVTDETQDGYTLDDALLRWNYLENVARYEICVTDALGNEYSENYSVKDGALVKDYPEINVNNWEFPSYRISSLAGMNAYIKNAEAAVSTAKDPTTEKTLVTFAPGQAYSFKVRAVNVYQEWDASKNAYGKEIEVPGDWSTDVATYTAPAMAAITNLHYEPDSSADDDYYYYFSYTEALADTTLFYQIATNDQFTSDSLITGTESTWRKWTADLDDPYKFAIEKSYSKLKPSTMYYVRAVNSTKAPEKNEVANMTFAVASFTTDAQKAPKNITGLYVYKTTATGNVFRFDGVLDSNVDSFVLQYTNKANAAEEDWVSYSEGETNLPLSVLKEGTNYVRAIAYVTVDDEKVYGQPSNVVEVTKSTATSAVGDLAYAEKNQSGYLFKITGTPRKDEEVEFWYSTAADFASDRKITTVEENNDGLYQIDFEYLTPGQTYYVRARVYNENAKLKTEEYSAFSNTVTFKAGMARISVDAAVTSTSVTLSMNAEADKQYLSGYQIQKKVNKKYVTLTRTSDSTYKEAGLAKDTTYTYRVRPYYYNTETGKTTNGTWKYYQTMTWGSSLGLSALPKSKTSIKLSWNKVKGAGGYEVYRKVSSSDATTITSGKANGYEKYTLVKTITKASTKSYTDKKLMSGVSYDYMVRAYRKVGNKKYYITEYITVDTGFGAAVQIRRSVKYANGKVKIYWTPNYSADGYVIEKYDDTTDQWTVVAKKKKSVYAYTFAAVTEDTKYRIRAYRGTEFSEPTEDIWVLPYLATVTGVKAKANAADGSITVSWKAVAGADYYEVYRTTSSESVYDKTSKTYIHSSDSAQVPVYVADEATLSGYRLVDGDKLTGTTLVDHPVSYTLKGVTKTEYDGPTPGVKYYYYVVARKNGSAYIYDNQYDEKTDSEDYWYKGGSKAASATVTQVTVKKPTMKSLKVAKGKITVRWKKVSKAQGYVIYRSTKKSSGYSKIALVTKGSATSYVDKTVKAKTKYYYVVKAIRYNEAGAMTYSSSSKKKSATAK